EKGQADRRRKEKSVSPRRGFGGDRGDRPAVGGSLGPTGQTTDVREAGWAWPVLNHRTPTLGLVGPTDPFPVHDIGRSPTLLESRSPHPEPKVGPSRHAFTTLREPRGEAGR